MKKTFAERFFERTSEDPKTGCLLWTGGKAAGYGYIYSGNTRIAAHRWAWSHVHGEIPKGLVVRHYVCRTPACVNEKHLRIGTPQDNVDDMVRDGTAARGEKHGTCLYPESRAVGDRNGSRTCPEALVRGETHAFAKLTNADIDSIFYLRSQNFLQREIARRFGVKREAISKILCGKRWTHLHSTYNKKAP